MTRKISIPMGFALFFSCFAMVIMLNSGEAMAAQPLDNMALVVVSGNTESSELGKAVSFYDYLLDEGYSPDNILFLTPSSVPGSDGTSNLSNVEDGFDALVDDDEEDKDIVIYISDHCGGYVDHATFEFSSETLNVSTVDGWIDDMIFDDLTFIIGGGRSGLAGPELDGSGRVIISSMSSTDQSFPDQFNMTRGLECGRADFNNDGRVSFIEAFFMEKFMLFFEDQTPQIWT